MSQLTVLSIDAIFMGMKETIHPVVLQDANDVVLVDCGYINSLELLEDALQKNNIMLKSITHLVMTHHDHDHMGNAAQIKETYPHIKIVASQEETPYISGDKKSPRLIQAEHMQQYLPEQQKEFGEKFCAILRSVRPVEVDIEVKDGDTFDWCGGCKIVSTPGHTKGHISLLVTKDNILIAGDAAALEENKLVVANPQFTLDLEGATDSLNKIKNMGADKIICYHGGIC